VLMLIKLFKNCQMLFIYLYSGCFVIPAYAEVGHCNYDLYSKALGHSLRVCQTANSPAQCGVLKRRNYDRSRAHAVRKKDQKIKFIKGDCSVEAVVGVCDLRYSRLFFYEGDIETLAEGCDRMKGRWDVRRL